MSSVRSLSMLTQNVLVSAHLCGRIYMWDTREKSSNWPWLKPVLVYYPTNTTAAVMTVAAHPADYHLVCFYLPLYCYFKAMGVVKSCILFVETKGERGIGEHELRIGYWWPVESLIWNKNIDLTSLEENSLQCSSTTESLKAERTVTNRYLITKVFWICEAG